ncbi:MAG: hypothetical protein WBM08_11180 [Prochlorococcaceae cyanobacterium]
MRFDGNLATTYPDGIFHEGALDPFTAKLADGPLAWLRLTHQSIRNQVVSLKMLNNVLLL